MIDELITYNDDTDFALGICAGGEAVQYNKDLIDELNLQLSAISVEIYDNLNVSDDNDDIKYWEGQREALNNSIKAINKAFNIVGGRLGKRADIQLDQWVGGDA